MRVWGILALLLAGAAAAWAQGDVIEVPVDKGWQAVPEWAPTEKAARHDSAFRDGCASFRASGGGRVMIWACSPRPRIDVRRMRYVSLRYRLTHTDPSLFSYLLYLDSGAGGGMYSHNLAFGANDLIHDGDWHTATTTLHPYGEIGTLALRFRALEGKEGRLDLAHLRFSADAPRSALSEVLDWRAGAGGLAGRPVSLDALRRTALPEVQQALALSDWFPAEEAAVEGVSFRVPTTGAVALSTTPSEKGWYSVPIGNKAAALYLLMGAGFPYSMLSYEGWAPDDMTERPEQFRVAIRYADGTGEEQVPYCLGKHRHGVWRGLHAYALPVAPAKEVREIRLWDGMQTSAFHLVALTAAGRSLMPRQPDAAVHTPAGGPPAATRPAVALRGSHLVARNRRGELRFDVSRGLSLAAARNAANPGWAVRPQHAPLFSVTEQHTVWDSRTFRRVGPIQVSGTSARGAFTHGTARLAVEITIEALPDEVSLRLRVRNQADRPRTLDVTFPQVRLATLSPREAPAQPLARGSTSRAADARAADLWYFYPSAYPVWSGRDGNYETPYSGEFPLQFEDVYDRARGGGLTVGTRDRALRQRYFGLRKAGGQVTMRVDYRQNSPLPPGKWVEYPRTVLALHGGDWKPAFAAYGQWLRGWYRPQHRPIGWYQRVWNFRTWWTHTMGDGRPEANLFDRQTGEFQVERFLKRDREEFGRVDMVHFFDWRISAQYGAYGDFSHYDDIGGLEKFRGMVRSLQARGVRVGLYLDCYLCSRKSLIGQKHGEEWALRRQEGGFGTGYSTPEDPMLNMCVRHPGWQDYLARTCARVARETGCDGIYLDEGLSDLEVYWCWSKEHGHPVPGTNQEGLQALARKVRATLPDHVALYTEWTPADALAPHIDGAYRAARRSCDPNVSPGLVQLARFAFPDLKVFAISNAGSMYDAIWEGTKYNLFNGVPLYSLAWGHDPEGLPVLRKMSGILHAHDAAFRTRSPELYVDTLRRDVYCNAFPGGRETVWTFWNGRHQTITGPLLRVKHVPGARYRDLWNSRDLRPAIEGGSAVIATTIGPRGIGAVAQIRAR